MLVGITTTSDSLATSNFFLKIESNRSIDITRHRVRSSRNITPLFMIYNNMRMFESLQTNNLYEDGDLRVQV